jgi:polysaccharide deacetylase family protein (PEP-CTERM system associated)
MQVDNILSFDIEDWFHPEVLNSKFPTNTWDKLENRVQKNTELILNFLSKKKLKATFFYLGWIAENNPNLIKDTVSDGHEIASHGYSHKPINKLTVTQFKNELKTSIDILNSISGKKVKGFRAPTFSVIKDTLWVFPILAEFGLTYDSSVYPIYHDRYGIPSAPKNPFIIYKNGKDTIVEFPMSTIELSKFNLPFGGGGYFRLYPLWLTIKFMKRCQKENRPIIFYAHPWELDKKNPQVELHLFNRFRHYHGIDRFLDRLDEITDLFNFTSFEKSNLWGLKNTFKVFKVHN